MKTSLSHALKSGVATIVVGTALLAGQAALAQAAPPPQPADPAEANSIIVTGSIVRNPAAATASPVTSLTSQDLASKGITTVSDALQQLTANNAGTNPTSWTSFGFATGASAPSLRGLNDAYTLTLFNGMRSAPYPLGDDGYRNFVDINTIPESIVDRIDVLQDGASATYGSDAIAGVVNVIIKKQVTGLHANASAGISQRGDSGERRIDVTSGFGRLEEDGYNVYVNGEYQINDPLYVRDRGFPFNTADQSSFCNGGTCLNNSVRNGLQTGSQSATGYSGFQSTSIPYVRPYTPGLVSLGGYQLANPAAGCGPYNSITLTPAQRGVSGTTAGGQFVTPATVCQEDLVKEYRQYSPWIQRMGGNIKGTVKVGENAEAWLMFNFYNTRTRSNITPAGYTGQTADGGAVVAVAAIYLPAYVCPQGVGVLTGTSITATGCTAANGTLNPNNPFAASGNYARLLALPTQTRGSETNAKTYRVSGGIDGTFGNGFNYSLGATASQVVLDIKQTGYIYLQGLMNAVAQGTFNFVNPAANTAAQNQIVFPDNNTHSVSKLTQIQGSLNKDMFTLPGGSLNVAVTAQYRYEAIHNPSANPANNVNPTQRYYSINAVGVDGSRSVWSAGYEITAPVVEGLKLKALGAYDHYSTGQARFSPKFEAEFRPIEQVKIRGTYSKGFRIPSFSESFAQPTTGYTSAQIVCGPNNSNTTYGAFCAAHATNPSYYSGGYSPGQTSSGNPNLQPEKSTSYTAGIVLQPTRRITLTADYWYTKITNVIIPVSISNDVFTQYYTQNGVVNIPGITVTPGTPDPQNPGALPLLGSVVGSYKNANQFLAKGIDMSAKVTFPLNDNGLRWKSDFSASYLMRLEQILETGEVQRFDGTLGPCSITSCSGAPKWRLTWTNTLDFNDRASVSLTANYTSGFSEVATDSGGTYGDCQQSTTDGQIVGYPDGTPVLCRSKSVFDLDGHAQIKIADRFTLYGDMLNILNKRPPYDPNTAYGLYQFNPAWAGSQFVGRYFRVGAKVDF